MTLNEIRRRPTLPGRFKPSTISVLRLNFCVRDGNRWIPQAIVTGKEQGSRLSLPRFLAPSVVSFLLPPDFPFALPPARVQLSLHTPCLRSQLLASHPQNRTGSASASLCLTMASLSFRLRHSLLRPLASSLRSAFLFQIILPDQALDRLVSPSSIHYCTSTDDLSTLSSSRGLTRF